MAYQMKTTSNPSPMHILGSEAQLGESNLVSSNTALTHKCRAFVYTKSDDNISMEIPKNTLKVAWG